MWTLPNTYYIYISFKVLIYIHKFVFIIGPYGNSSILFKILNDVIFSILLNLKIKILKVK